MIRTVYLFFILWILHASYGDTFSPRRNLRFQEMANYDGYPAESHFVPTKDGYVLNVFRIPPNKQKCPETKEVTLFAHGLYLSGDDCIVPGPGIGHCYTYSDNCHDVWVINFRGNVYSRNHTSRDPDKDSEFWNFTFDDMAMYDLPAVIDYILVTTSRTQISYVAHSQGVAVLLILCAKVPEYNAKIKVGIGLSATAWLYHSKFFILQLQGVMALLLTQTGLLTEEIFSRGGFIQRGAEILCGVSKLPYPICSFLIFALFGYDEFQITSEILPVIVGHTPSGTSVKNANRWGQIVQTGFCEYDYGPIKNLLVYGNKKPPEYDVSKITMKWVILASSNDVVADLEDVKYLVSKLPNASLCVISNEKFSHLDFIYGKDISRYITPVALSTIATGYYECT